MFENCIIITNLTETRLGHVMVITTQQKRAGSGHYYFMNIHYYCLSRDIALRSAAGASECVRSRS